MALEESSRAERPLRAFRSLVTVRNVLLGAFLLKLWLVAAQTVSANGVLVHDDELFPRLANEIVNGRWLGSFDQFTLIKGPFFSLWIAFVSRLGIALQQSQHLLYGGACALFLVALRPLQLRPAARIAIFAALLFHPITYDWHLLRVIRDSLYSAETLLIVALCLGIVLRSNGSARTLVPWAAGLGCAIAAFWMTREEGVWLLPLVGLLWGLAGVNSWRHTQKRHRCVCVYSISPLLALALVGAVAYTNKVHYGLFGIVELKQPDFLSAYGALTRVQPLHWYPQVPVSNDTRARIYAVSPAFAKLQPDLESNATNWSKYTWSGADPASASEMKGGWFLWALLRAAADAGFHSSAPAAAAFYGHIAKEVNDACAAGTLSCLPRHDTLTPRLRREYLRPWGYAMARGAWFLIGFREFSPYPVPSNSPSAYAALTRDRLSPMAGTTMPKPARLQILDIMGLLYQTVMPVLAIAAVVWWLYRFVGCVRRRRVDRPTTIAAALFGVLALRLAILAFIDVSSFSGIETMYFAPMYPLLICFCFFSALSCDWIAAFSSGRPHG